MTAIPYARPELLDADRPRNHLLALGIAIVIFSALSLYGAIYSNGFLEMDACTHYIIARFAISEPTNIVSVWGRPLCTGLYMLPALFGVKTGVGGVVCVRAMSLLLAITCGYASYRVAKNLGFKLPALAPILLFAQPIFYLHSFSELTEIPFALVAILAFWAYQSKRFLLMTILVSITPMGRPEGFGLMMIAAVALVAHGKWHYLPIMPLPLMLWSFAGWWVNGASPEVPWYLWLKKEWPYSPRSMYGTKPFWHFYVLLPVLLSPIVFPSFVLGVWHCLRAGLSWRGVAVTAENQNVGLRDRIERLPFFTDHTARCTAMACVIPLSILFAHSILATFGLMASNGELRYLVCVAPLWAIVCAKGWEWAWMYFRIPAPYIFAGIAALLPIAANFYWQVVPLRLYDDNLLAREVAEWYQKHPTLAKDYPKMMSTHPMIYLFMDVSQNDRVKSYSWGRKSVEKLPPGVILVWDEIYGTHNSDEGLCVSQADVEAAGWIWIGNFLKGGNWCNVYLSPTTIHNQPVDKTKYFTPRIH